MKIALLGYGKMGKAIEKIAKKRGHDIVLKVEEDIDSYEIDKMEIDVAIDFSIPQAAFKNISTSFKNNIPVVCGTTGWLDNYKKAVELCKEEDSAFIYASNFSLGVNLFFELNKTLAKMMNGMDDYDVAIEEIHHTQKQDAPSGTAISLAQQVIYENDNKKHWQLDQAGEDEIPIKAIRIDDVPGTHTVSYKSTIDSIEIKHTANSRHGFALGAVVASEWIKDKKGVYTMKDVLANQLKNV